MMTRNPSRDISATIAIALLLGALADAARGGGTPPFNPSDARAERSLVADFHQFFASRGYNAFAIEPCTLKTPKADAEGRVLWTLDPDRADDDNGCLARALGPVPTSALGDLAFLLAIEGAPSPEAATDDATLTLRSRPGQEPRIARTLRAGQPSSEVVVTTNRCYGASCVPRLILEGDPAAPIRAHRATLLGVFAREAKPLVTKGSPTLEFVNGTFGATNGSGWQWEQFDCINCMPPIGKPISSNVKISTSRFQCDAEPCADLLGGFGNSFQPTVNADRISQTIASVPLGHRLVFERFMAAGASSPPFTNGIVTAEIRADNLTTGQTNLLLYREQLDGITTASRPWSARAIDVSGLGGDAVRFRFVGIDPIHNASGHRKAIVRFDSIRFDPLPIAPNANPTPGFWWNPNRNGNGFDFQRNDSDQYVLTWYTYQANGTPIWYISDSKRVVSGRWTSTIFKSTWNAGNSTNSLTPVGDVRFEFTGDNTGRFSWDLWSENGDNAGYDATETVGFFFGTGHRTGLWFEPAQTGWGISIAYQNQAGPDTIATVFFYDGSQPTWAQGVIEGTPTGGIRIGLRRFTGLGLCPQCTGSQSLTNAPGGNVYLDLGSLTGTARTRILLPSGARWDRGTTTMPVPMARLTRP